MAISKANAQWVGSLKAGHGTMKPAHGAETTFSAGTRFEGQPGSNPEELLGAAHAGCFSMALSAGLERAGAVPKNIRTTADVTIERGPQGFTITAVTLTTTVEASGIDRAKFAEIVETTKKGCPVSRALTGIPSITVNATLAGS